MGVGLGLLRLAPDEFWSMTPRELECAMRFGLPKRAEAPDAADLACLMHLFPDGD